MKRIEPVPHKLLELCAEAGLRSGDKDSIVAPNVMTAQDITKLLERSPFVPFRLHLSNGQTFEVKHPDFVWVFRTRLELAVPAAGDGRIMDHAEHVSLLHIARIEELPVAA